MAENDNPTSAVADDVWGDTQTPAPAAPAQAPATPTQAPAQPAQQATDPWSDPPDEKPTIVDKVKDYWNDRNSWINKSLLVDSSTRKQLDKEDALGQQIINHEIASAHPFRAALAQFYYGSLKDAADVSEQLTTPTQLALTVGGSALRAVKGVKSALMLANTYFAYQGGRAMIEDAHGMEGFAANIAEGKFEGDPEAVQRFLFGAAGLTQGLGGAGAEAKDIIRERVKKNLGLSGDLAAKVSASVQANNAIRQKAVNDAMAVHEQTREDVQAAEKAGAAKETQLSSEAQRSAADAVPRLSQIMHEAGIVVTIGKAQVEAPFEDMYREHPERVTDGPSLRASLIDTIKSHGIEDHEIPASIFNALAERGKAPESLMDLGGGPEATEILKDLPEEDQPKPVDQRTLARVSQDLWQAANSAKDTKIEMALKDALHSVNKMRQDFADQNGFGEKFSKAMRGYKQFKRDLGSGMMDKFLQAEDFQDEHMAKRMASTVSPTEGAALRDLLKTFGVDTKPMEDLIANSKDLEGQAKAVPGQTKEAVSTIKAAGKERITDIGKKATDQIADLGKNSPIVPEAADLSPESLQGKSNQEIRQAAISSMEKNMKSSGMSKPYAFMQIGIGVLRMVLGSSFGMMTAGMGAARLTTGWRASMIKNPAFQDWVIRESGVEPNNTPLIKKMRGAMDRWYPTLRRLEKTGAPARAASQLATSGFRAGTPRPPQKQPEE